MWCNFEILRPMVLRVGGGRGVLSQDQGKGNRSHPQEWAGGEGNSLLINSTYLESICLWEVDSSRVPEAYKNLS